MAGSPLLTAEQKQILDTITEEWALGLAAAFLDMPLRKAIPSVVLGVVVAGFVISCLAYGITSLF